MKTFRHWKVILLLILVFAAGGVTGSVVTSLLNKRAFLRGFDVEHKTDEAMSDLQRELKLTPEQQPKIKAILLDTGHKFERSFGQAFKDSGTNLVSAWKQIGKELTPDQKIVFQRKCQKFREGVKKSLKADLPPD
jgi:hypothetical protein